MESRRRPVRAGAPAGSGAGVDDPGRATRGGEIWWWSRNSQVSRWCLWVSLRPRGGRLGSGRGGEGHQQSPVSTSPRQPAGGDPNRRRRPIRRAGGARRDRALASMFIDAVLSKLRAIRAELPKNGLGYNARAVRLPGPIRNFRCNEPSGCSSGWSGGNERFTNSQEGSSASLAPLAEHLSFHESVAYFTAGPRGCRRVPVARQNRGQFSVGC